MLELIRENIHLIIALAVALFTVLFVICVIRKFFQAAVGLVILSVLIPILFTVFWGDGTEYVHEFASYFAEPYKENITEFYDTFKERDLASPLIDYGAVSEKATHVFETAAQKADGLLGSGGSR